MPPTTNNNNNNNNGLQRVERTTQGLSLFASGALVITTTLGFQLLSQVSIDSVSDVESTTTLGCLLVLGFSFGLLLFCAEFGFCSCVGVWVFSLFGFLRYRVGRLVLYWISGFMTVLTGRTCIILGV